MKNDTTPGPMKAWLVEHEDHVRDPFITLDSREAAEFEGIRVFKVTPMTAVPCPEGMQVGDRVAHEAGFQGHVADAIDAHGRLYVLADGRLTLCHPSRLTPIPDEPERTYTKQEAQAIKRLKAWAANPYEGPEAEIARDVTLVLARLREQGGER